ncbi:hypothetical protein [Mesorhizobium sophorae]|uniref:hypothetical protein n=1 Tax=Mesorhizobium sophorae TaxID=1300294 RepID=UPI000BA4B370|nr:hypothetical protein [Mesorhizobium sophorae]
MKDFNSKSRISATIEYAALGTVSIDQLTQALWEDVKALQDFYGVRFVTGAKLIIPSTNEYGHPMLIKHPDGRVVRRYDTHYYRPACLDYKL